MHEKSNVPFLLGNDLAGGALTDSVSMNTVIRSKAKTQKAVDIASHIASEPDPGELKTGC